MFVMIKKLSVLMVMTIAASASLHALNETNDLHSLEQARNPIKTSPKTSSDILFNLRKLIKTLDADAARLKANNEYINAHLQSPSASLKVDVNSVLQLKFEEDFSKIHLPRKKHLSTLIEESSLRGSLKDEAHKAVGDLFDRYMAISIENRLVYTGLMRKRHEIYQSLKEKFASVLSGNESMSRDSFWDIQAILNDELLGFTESSAKIPQFEKAQKAFKAFSLELFLQDRAAQPQPFWRLWCGVLCGHRN